jgi:NAD+ kinase
MTKGFQRIALIGREGTEGVPETLTALIDHLLTQKKQVVLEETTAHMIKNTRLTAVDAEDLKKNADLLIVVGGDGSMLNAAHIAVQQHLPVLGINRGRLGFLTDIPPDHLDKIDAILKGQYQEEKRFLLTAHIKHDGKKIANAAALNDVVLLPGNVAQMIEFDIYINDELVCSQRADGLIVATPTGSTAYALSGGGPILHPSLDAIVIVPMFPHTLSSRPIVVKDDSHIKIIIAKENNTSPNVSCDGQTRVAVSPGGQIEIQKNAENLRLIHPHDYNYYDTLRRKLDWEKRAVRV